MRHDGSNIFICSNSDSCSDPENPVLLRTNELLLNLYTIQQVYPDPEN